MLKQRLMTAAIIIPVILALLYFLPIPAFCITLSIIALLAAWEWTKLMGLTRFATRILYLLIVALALFNSLFIPVNYIFTIGFLWWCVALILICKYECGGKSWWGQSVFWRGLMGLLTIAPCWAAFNYVRGQRDGFYALVFLLVLVCGADSVAYFVGNKWGRHKLAPLVSPGKSIEGVLGALVFAVVLSILTLWMTGAPVTSWFFAILLSAVTVLFSVVGDLFESMLKRNVGLKDSGNILPGHGGVLDRMDSLTAAVPVFAFGAALLGSV